MAHGGFLYIRERGMLESDPVRQLDTRIGPYTSTRGNRSAGLGLCLSPGFRVSVHVGEFENKRRKWPCSQRGENARREKLSRRYSPRGRRGQENEREREGEGVAEMVIGPGI